jgi:tetratricopeptide (TPR) repeat protein
MNMNTNTTQSSRRAVIILAVLASAAVCPTAARAQTAVAAATARAQSTATSVAVVPQTAVHVPKIDIQVPATTIRVPPVAVQIPDLDLQRLEAVQKSIDSIASIDAMKAYEDALARVTTPIDAVAMSLFDLQAQQGRTPIASRPMVAARVMRDESLYESGLSALDNEQWQRAADVFDRVVKAGGAHMDGAMYWKAYALDRLGNRADALSTLQDLAKAYPNSRYLDDAKALEIEVKQNAGQMAKPEDHANEDLKLIAINSLMQTDPERAIPLLEQVLKGHDSLKVKQRALFVLGTNDSPRAREVLGAIARGGANPDLQLKAIRYLGMRGRSSSSTSNNAQLLADIYASSKDSDVKREIIRSLMMAHDVDHLLNIAKTESSPDLRIEAIRQLGMMRADNELLQLYQVEKVNDIKEQIVRSMVMSGNTDRVAEVARQETDAKLRANAVRDLGMMDSKKTGDMLVQIYKADKDPGVKKQIVSTLSMQGNAKALVDLARGETDPGMKKEIVSRLSMMKSKEATDYMLELLK